MQIEYLGKTKDGLNIIKNQDGEKVLWTDEYLLFMLPDIDSKLHISSMPNVDKNSSNYNTPNKKQTVLTHNCGARMVCGRLGSVASRMALDNQDATTIDGTRKGAGIVKSQGEVTHVQYYFELQKWIVSWFKKRGLTENGYMPSEDPNATIDPASLDFGDDEDMSINRDKTEIDFANVHREVDHTQNQKFKEV